MSETSHQQENTNQIPASDPDCDLVEDIFNGFSRFLVLENTLKTDIFDNMEMESSPVSVATLSTKYGYHPDILERLLDNLACMKLVRKHQHDGVWLYVNTRSTSIYLTKGSEFYKGNALQADKILIGKTSSSLAQTLKTGPLNQMENFMSSGTMTNANIKKQDVQEGKHGDSRNLNNNNNNNNNNIINNNNNNTTDCGALQCQENKGSDTGTKTSSTHHSHGHQSPTKTSKEPPSKPDVKTLMSSMDAMMYSCRHVLPDLFDLSCHRVAVDLGGGCGYLARLLTGHYHQMTATVFELPHVVAMARDSSDDGVDDVINSRVDFVAGNFFTDDLPPSDLYILSRVLHCWDETRCQILLNKIYRTLPPGGKLLILEKFLNERKDGPASIMSIHLNMSSISNGRERTATEYQTLVEGQGFTETKVKVIAGVNLFDALLACKPI